MLRRPKFRWHYKSVNDRLPQGTWHKSINTHIHIVACKALVAPNSFLQSVIAIYLGKLGQHARRVEARRTGPSPRNQLSSLGVHEQESGSFAKRTFNKFITIALYGRRPRPAQLRGAALSAALV